MNFVMKLNNFCHTWTSDLENCKNQGGGVPKNRVLLHFCFTIFQKLLKNSKFLELPIGLPNTCVQVWIFYDLKAESLFSHVSPETINTTEIRNFFHLSSSSSFLQTYFSNINQFLLSLTRFL